MSGQTLRVMSADLIALIVTALQRGMVTLELQVTPGGEVVVFRGYGRNMLARETYELADHIPVCPLCFIEQVTCLLVYSEEVGQSLITSLRDGVQNGMPAKIVLQYVQGGWAARLVNLPVDQLYRSSTCIHHS